MKLIPVAVEELREGDLVDLEGDTIADPKSDSDAWRFEYGEVMSVEWETATCVKVDFGHESIGFPPGHVVKVVP